MAALVRVYRQCLVRVIGTAIWSSAVLLSQPGKSKAVRRRWFVADRILGNLELLRMLIDAGIRPKTNAFLELIRRVHPVYPGVFRRPDSFVDSRTNLSKIYKRLPLSLL